MKVIMKESSSNSHRFFKVWTRGEFSHSYIHSWKVGSLCNRRWSYKDENGTSEQRAGIGITNRRLDCACK